MTKSDFQSQFSMSRILIFLKKKWNVSLGECFGLQTWVRTDTISEWNSKFQITVCSPALWVSFLRGSR